MNARNAKDSRDSSYVEAFQQLSERHHPAAAVAIVRGADALPAIRRRRDPAVGADGRGVGVVLHVVSDVQSVELREHADTLGAQQRHALGRDAAQSDPDGVHAELLEAPARVQNLLRHAAVDAADGDVRPWTGLGRPEDRHGEEGREHAGDSGHTASLEDRRPKARRSPPDTR